MGSDNKYVIGGFCLYTAVITVAAVWLLICIFPETKDSTSWTFKSNLNLSNDQGLILLALLAGIIGSVLHAGQSIVVFVGNQSFAPSWALWYFARPWIGGLLGLLIYFVLRAGLASPAPTSVTPYGVVAFGALAGLFSQKASEKLKEVFEVLFRTDGKLADALEEGAGATKIIAVDVVPAQQPNMKTLIVKGDNFKNGAEIALAGNKVPTRFVSNQKLEATVPDNVLPAAGQSLPLTVTNPAPQTIASAPFPVQG